MSRQLDATTIAAYAAPLVPVWMLHAPALSILPGIYASVADIELAVIGTILVVSRLIDAVTDPVIGVLSDRTRTPIGSRKPWILAGSTLCIPGVWFWFQPSAETGAMYFLLASVMVYVGWTMIEVPHGAWLSELSSDYEERSYVSGVRTAAAFLGHILFWLAPFLPFFATTDITPAVTAFLAWVVILLIVLTAALAVAIVPDGRTGNAAAPNLRMAFAALVSNKPLRLYSIIILSSWLASGMVAGLYFFFISNYLALPQHFGHIGLTVAVIGFATAPAWGWLAARVGKHRVLAFCSLSTTVTLVAMAMIQPGPNAFSGVLSIFAFSALFGTGSTVVYYALMADVVDYDRLMTRQNNAGNYFALITMLQKIGVGAGAGAALTIASLFGFDARGDNEGLALAGFFLALIGLPAVLNLLAAALAAVFPIDEHRQDVIRRRLESRARREARGVDS